MSIELDVHCNLKAYFACTGHVAQHDEQVTGEPLMQRGDDTADKLKNRLKVFHKETQPVINHYAKSGKVAHIDASQDMEAVSQAIRNQL
jgi:adenylate kinase